MARRLPKGSAGGAGGGGRFARAVPHAKRAWPVVLMAWERWQQLSPEDKERYKRQARGYAERAKTAADNARRRRGGRGPGR